MRAALVFLYTVAMPPAEYDRPYNGSLEIQYADPRDVSGLCGMGRLVRACAITSKDHCRVIFPRDVGIYSKKTLTLMMRHEIAHCNGWRHH